MLASVFDCSTLHSVWQGLEVFTGIKSLRFIAQLVSHLIKQPFADFFPVPLSLHPSIPPSLRPSIPPSLPFRYVYPVLMSTDLSVRMTVTVVVSAHWLPWICCVGFLFTCLRHHWTSSIIDEFYEWWYLLLALNALPCCLAHSPSDNPRGVPYVFFQPHVNYTLV